ncbi:hypothetical protein AB0M20_04595, partial [Actinoplanes sp. NPDC051633]|uniref:hypothetical protein n=1 Tax=Actinoplanes sp. NPDC051633 TaxID=3155670 RepID=UPI00343AF66E
APHHEFDATPDEAVKAGMAPDPDWFAAEKAITFGGWETVDRTGRPAYSLQIIGATHLSFMDVPFLPVGEDSPARGLLATTAIDPARMREVMTTLLVAFLATGDIAGASASEVVRTTTTPLPRATTGTAGDVA